MPELRYFNDIDIDDPNEDPGAIEAAEFYLKLDHEGGLTALLDYGGAEFFPEPLQTAAQKAEYAIEVLEAAAAHWAAERGVEY